MKNQLNLLFDIKPISYNESYVAWNGAIISNTARKKFSKDLQQMLQTQIKELKKLKGQKIDSLEVRYIFAVPELRTKSGSIAKRSLDIDNCIKALQDEIFIKLSGINSNIDDGLITKIIAEKVQASTDKHQISVSIHW